MMGKIKKIVEIGPYPPPDTGWSVRLKKLKHSFEEQGHECVVLNTGKNRKVKSDQYLRVNNGLDYVLKLIYLKFKRYSFHIHTNAQAVKGPILCLVAHLVSLMFFERASITLHGGYKQLYFPKHNGGRMYGVIYLNFLLSKRIICNDDIIKQFVADYGSFIHLGKIFPIQGFSYQYMDYSETRLPEKVESYLAEKQNIIMSYIALRNGFFLETLTRYIENRSDEAGIVITGAGKVEDPEIVPFYEKLFDLEKNGKVVLVDALNHDEFITLMKRSDIFLRTPDSDGISASVLEALASGTVVVACDNGKRPESVITYKADDAVEMQEKIELVLGNLNHFKANIVRPDIIDTVKEEVDVLLNA